MLKLYANPLSTYSRRVEIALLEKDIPFERIVVDMRARKHREPDYLALNPYGRVPTLVDENFVLYESAAILNYLEAKHPEPALVPEDMRGRALVDMHVRLCDLQLARPAGAIIFPKRFLPKEQWDQTAIARASGEIQKHLEIVARQLQGQDYLVANRYTLADVSYTPWLAFLGLMEVTVPAAVGAWAERLLTRDSAANTKPPM